LVIAAVLAPNAIAAGGTTERGAALFAEKCAMCHRVMGMGTVLLTRRRDPATAPLEKRTDLTVEFVVAAARAGLGNMPRISRGEVSDADLATIAAWLAVPAAAPTPTPAPPAAN
jgi:mono/diheme cytochrome c family protein